MAFNHEVASKCLPAGKLAGEQICSNSSSIIPIVHSETNEKKTSKVYEYCSKNVCAIHYPKGLSAARSPKDFLRRHKK